MSTLFDRGITLLLALAAIALASAVVKREFFGSSVPTRQAPSPPTFVSNWQTAIEMGTRMGDPKAAVTIVEFADLECPFCRKFHEGALRKARTQFGSQVSIVYVDFPLVRHRFARPAAQAAACARQQGRFSEFLDAVYATQDSLGLTSWRSYASQAGVPDLKIFDRCVDKKTPLTFADSAISFGLRIGVTGTPGILVNGWEFQSPPTDSALSTAIKRLLAGEPVAPKKWFGVF